MLPFRLGRRLSRRFAPRSRNRAFFVFFIAVLVCVTSTDAAVVYKCIDFGAGSPFQSARAREPRRSGDDVLNR